VDIKVNTKRGSIRTGYEEDLIILEYLKKQKLQGVKFLCSRYAISLEVVAFRILGDIDKAKDIVFDTFWNLWVEQKFSDVMPPLRPFLNEEIKKACNTVEL
jgi:hypothetical protein